MTPTTTISNGVKPADLQSKDSAYDLSINGLENLAAFEHTPAGLCLVSKVSLPAGAHFTYLTSHEPQPKASWKTIQTSRNTQTDPQSALLYMNHSCAPSVEVHTFAPVDGKYPQQPPNSALNGEATHLDKSVGLAGEVRVARDRDVKPGDALTFFYPSTEWHMDRPFECLCGAGEGICLGQVDGAEGIDAKTLQRWFINQHIQELANERDAK